MINLRNKKALINVKVIPCDGGKKKSSKLGKSFRSLLRIKHMTKRFKKNNIQKQFRCTTYQPTRGSSI